MRVVTVFGATGFIGRYVVRQLARHGAQVRVATRNTDAANFLRPLGDVGQVVPVPVNLAKADAAALDKLIAGSDGVVNLVGLLAEGGGQKFSRLQAEAPGLLAEAAARNGVKRFVQISAIGADADSDAEYAETKARGEAAVKAAFPAATILRPSIVFGPEDKFFNRFAGMARSLPVVPLVGADTKFQPVYVGDVAAAVMAGLTKPETAGQTYELGGPRCYSFTELVQFIADTIKVSPVILPLPLPVGKFMALFMQMLPGKPLTLDQVKLLQKDNVVAEGALTLADMGIVGESIEAVVPTYLARFRPGGRFAGVHGN